MNSRDYLDHSLKDDLKRHHYYSSMQKHCKNCGHSVFVVNVDRIICSWCGKYVYKDDKTEFSYKIKENLNKRNGE